MKKTLLLLLVPAICIAYSFHHYEMNGNVIIAKNSVGGLDFEWDVVGVADFTGDGKINIDDLVLLAENWLRGAK